MGSDIRNTYNNLVCMRPILFTYILSNCFELGQEMWVEVERKITSFQIEKKRGTKMKVPVLRINNARYMTTYDVNVLENFPASRHILMIMILCDNSCEIRIQKNRHPQSMSTYYLCSCNICRYIGAILVAC